MNPMMMMNPMMAKVNAFQQFMQGMGGHAGGQSHVSSCREHVEGFWQGVAEGKWAPPEAFDNYVRFLMKQETDNVMAQHGYVAEGFDVERHHRYKHVMEELREASPNEVGRLIEAKFHGLTAEARKVLVALSQECSKAKLAAKAGMSKERFVELKAGLRDKLVG